MSISITFKKLAMCSLSTAAMVTASQGVFAHTRLQVPTILEGARVYNNEVIGHGCHNEVANNTSTPVMGTSVVFPDATATVTSKPAGSASSVAGTPAGNVTDYLAGAGEGYSKKVYSKDLFSDEGQKSNSLGNVVGYWTGGGSLPGINYAGLIPFKTDAITIKPESCANTVTFVVAIADVCTLTNASGFSDETVNLWTPAVGSNFDGPGLHAYNSPATLKVVRNITGTPATLTTAAVAANPLPASCGEGLDITVTPTAEQINRDMPAIDGNGVQVWPQP
ncbi:MAG: hypothetical protein PHG00_07060 [Methylococcales bacterium]|nr:hypothetical protein [Methylococcales bacterium]